MALITNFSKTQSASYPEISSQSPGGSGHYYKDQKEAKCRPDNLFSSPFEAQVRSLPTTVLSQLILGNEDKTSSLLSIVSDPDTFSFRFNGTFANNTLVYFRLSSSKSSRSDRKFDKRDPLRWRTRQDLSQFPYNLDLI